MNFRFWIAVFLLIIVAACGPSATPPSVIPSPEEEGEESLEEIFTQEGFASVTIAESSGVGILDNILIIPVSAAVSSGGSFQFAALPVDQNGLPISGLAIRWSLKDGRVGAIDESGLFTAGSTLGDYPNLVEVVATQQTGEGSITKIGRASVTVTAPATAGLLNQVLVIPANASVPVGQFFSFSAVGLDTNGDIVQDVSFRWRMNLPAAGEIDPSGFFTAGNAPESYPNAIVVEGIQETEEGPITTVSFASVTVVNPVIPGSLHQVVIRPENVQLESGQLFPFTVLAFDPNGVPILNPEFAWSVIDSQAGTIDSAGVFIAGNKEGVFPNSVKVQVTQRTTDGLVTREAFASVTLSSAPKIGLLERVEILPRHVILNRGQRIDLNALGFDGRLLPLSNISLKWIMNSPEAGIIDNSGRFSTSDRPGVYPDAIKVEATQETEDGAITVTATASLTIVGPLERVMITPTDIALSAGQLLGFTAVGLDANGVAIPDLTLRWSITDPRVGTIDRLGIFTAGEVPGKYPDAIKVEATQRIPKGQ